jgi:uncharacterized protein (DUF58 family)
VKRSLALLLTSTALTVGAGALPSPALLVPAMGLAVVTVLAWTSVMVGARRLRVSRRLLTREAVEDAPILLGFEVRGLDRLPVRLEARVGGAWAPLDVGATEHALAIGRRGPYRLRPSRVRVRDALGIAERRLDCGRIEHVLVLPRPDTTGQMARVGASPADDLDLDGLAPYAPGMPVRRIHWPALARGAGLHARTFVPDAGGLPLVVIQTGANAEPGAVDWAARVAAGHIEALGRAGGCRVLLPGDRSPTTVITAQQWRAVHRRLARIQPSGPGTASAHVATMGVGVVCIDTSRAPAMTIGRSVVTLPPGVEPRP